MLRHRHSKKCKIAMECRPYNNSWCTYVLCTYIHMYTHTNYVIILERTSVISSILTSGSTPFRASSMDNIFSYCWMASKSFMKKAINW